MQNIVALAVDTKNNTCTCIYSEASFDELKDNYYKYQKDYRSTDWNGRDDIERTLKLENLELTGREFFCPGKHIGSDFDMGHTYSWEFNFDTIKEVRPISKKSIGEMTEEELQKAIHFDVWTMSAQQAATRSSEHRQDQPVDIQMLRYRLTFRKYFAKLIEEYAEKGLNQITILHERNEEFLPEVADIEYFDLRIMSAAFHKEAKVRIDIANYLRRLDYFVVEVENYFIVQW